MITQQIQRHLSWALDRNRLQTERKRVAKGFIVDKMKLALYNEIISGACNFGWKQDCVKQLSAMYKDISIDTLYSIVSQAYQRRIKKSYLLHHSATATKEYYEAYCAAAGTEPSGKWKLVSNSRKICIKFYGLLFTDYWTIFLFELHIYMYTHVTLSFKHITACAKLS